MNICSHAQKRLRQRGLSNTDVNLILLHGTETRDGYFLLNKDVKRAEEELRNQINRLHSLAGKYIVTDGKTLITSYHPTKRKQKRVLQYITMN